MGLLPDFDIVRSSNLPKRFYSTGFVALLSNNHLISVPRYEEPRPKLLASPPEGEVHSWTLIPPAYTLSRSVEVLLSVGQTIHVVDATESEDRLLDIGPFTHISVSPNGRFVALYTEAGKAYVITSDFQNRLSEHDSKAKALPMDCNGAVMMLWLLLGRMKSMSSAQTMQLLNISMTVGCM